MLHQNKGFEFSFDAERQILRIKAWGLWDTEFAKKLHQVFTEKLEELNSEGKERLLIVDFSKLAVQSQDPLDVVSQLIVSVKTQGLKMCLHSGEISEIEEQLQHLFVEDGVNRELALNLKNM